MKTLSIFCKTMLLSFAIILASSCGDDDGASPNNNNNNNNNGNNNNNNNDTTALAVEGPIEGTWKTGTDGDLGNLSGHVSSMEFMVDDGQRYSLTYNNRDGSVTLYEGSIIHFASQSEHTNGAAIWSIDVNVSKVFKDGVQIGSGGGWKGIYTFFNENRLLLNVECIAQGCGTPPAHTDGIGVRGDVWKFNRQ